MSKKWKGRPREIQAPRPPAPPVAEAAEAKLDATSAPAEATHPAPGVPEAVLKPERAESVVATVPQQAEPAPVETAPAGSTLSDDVAGDIRPGAAEAGKIEPEKNEPTLAAGRGSVEPAAAEELRFAPGAEDFAASRPVPPVPPQIKPDAVKPDMAGAASREPEQAPPELSLQEDMVRPGGRIPVLELDQAGPTHLAGERVGAAPGRRSAWSRYGAQAAMLAIAIGAGFGIAHVAGTDRQAAPALAEAKAALKQSREETARLEADLRSLKGSVETLKGGLERGRGDPARLTQLSERLERSERANQEANTKIARLNEQLDKAQRDPGRQAAALQERLERIERQVGERQVGERQVGERASASAPAQHQPAQSASASPPPPAQASAQAPIPTPPVKPSAAEIKAAADESPSRTGSIPEGRDAKDSKAPAKAAASETPATRTAAVEPAKSAGSKETSKETSAKEASPKSVRLDGWTLRDADGRNALVEDKDGRLREVAVGGTLPGLGKVESIDRRGKAWVVVTQKGFIGQEH